MKKTDVAMIILVATLAIGVTYLLLSSLPFFKDGDNPVKVKTATPISTELAEPSKDIFFDEAINPTVKIVIGSGDASTNTGVQDQTNGGDTNQESNSE